MMVLWTSWFLGSVLAYAAVAKTYGFAAFMHQISAITLASPAATRLIATVVLLAEYGVTLALLSGASPILALGLATSLLLIFTAFIVWVLSTGIKASCNCLGEGEADVSGLTLARNLFMLTSSSTALAISYYDVKLHTYSYNSIATAIQGVSAAILFMAAYQLATLWRLARSFV